MRIVLIMAALWTGAALAEAPPTAGAARPREAIGWLRTFAAEPVAPGAPFEAPDYLGSLVEAAARIELREALVDKGFKEAPAGSEGLMTLSVTVKEPKPRAKGLPQSPIRLEGVDSDPTDNIHDPEVRPFIALPSGKKADAAAPSVEVTIYARRGDRRIWSGFAGAPVMAGAGREEIARGLAAALIDHFGETIDLPETAITLEPGPAAGGIIER